MKRVLKKTQSWMIQSYNRYDSVVFKLRRSNESKSSRAGMLVRLRVYVCVRTDFGNKIIDSNTNSISKSKESFVTNLYIPFIQFARNAYKQSEMVNLK